MKKLVGRKTPRRGPVLKEDREKKPPVESEGKPRCSTPRWTRYRDATDKAGRCTKSNVAL